MARREDPAFAKAIGANVTEMATLDEPMTLASILDKSKGGKFFPTNFCCLS